MMGDMIGMGLVQNYTAGNHHSPNLKGETKASKISKSCVCKTFHALGLPSYQHCSHGIAGSSSSGQKTLHIAVFCYGAPPTHVRE